MGHLSEGHLTALFPLKLGMDQRRIALQGAALISQFGVSKCPI